MNKPLKFSSATHKLLWCSDLHLGHEPDWKDAPPLWKSRGFPSLAAHDAWVKEQWHALVDADTVVFNLGDATFSDPKGERFRQLTQWPGRQYLVNGNHWSGQRQIYLNAVEMRFPHHDTHGMSIYPTDADNLTFVGDQLHAYIDGVSVFMQHYPLFVWPELKAGGFHLHGHCHRRLPESNPEATAHGKVLDVGVDNALAYNGTPFFSWDDIKRIMARKPVVRRDHH